MWIFSCNIRTYYMAEVMNKQAHMVNTYLHANKAPTHLYPHVVHVTGLVMRSFHYEREFLLLSLF